MDNIRKLTKKVLQKTGLLRQMKRPSIKEWEIYMAKAVKKPVKMLLPHIREDAVLIDVGANVGVFTAAVQRARKNITAHLFEPVPRYYQWLTAKFSNNPRIIVNEIALSESKGHFQLWIDADNLGWNTMIHEKISGAMQEITIEAMTFDEYVQHHAIERIDAIKIDVEGAEFRVLNGMKKTLSQPGKKPVIICEIGWGKNSHPSWNEEVEVFEWLFDHGYRRFDYDSITTTTDVLFIPDDKKNAAVL